MGEGGKEKGNRKANIDKLPANGNYYQQNGSPVPEVNQT